MTTYCVANLKGGTAKTTTAAFLLHALAAKRPTLGVDADPPGSLLRWSELGTWTVPVVGMPVTDIHRRLLGVAEGYPDVVIDTPPLEDKKGIVSSALRAADVVLVPVAPSTMELDRLTPILDAVDEIAPLRDTELAVRVVLTRVVRSANSGENTRAVLADDGIRVLSTVIPQWQSYALAFPRPVQLDDDEPYLQMTRDLQESIR